MRYTRAELRKRFDARTYQRGLGYFEDARVSDVETADDGQIISGRVRGNHPKAYVTQVQLRDDARRFSGRCNCPMRTDCKHMVALLLHALEHQPQPGLSNAVSSWVEDLFALHQQDHAPRRHAVDNETRLSFDCSLPEHPEPHLAVSVRRKGNGQIKALSLTARWQRGHIRHTEERSLFNRLRAFADESPYVARLAEAGSGELFEDLVRSGQCHWNGQRKALQLDHPRQAEASWKLHEDGSQSLQLIVAPRVTVLPLDPPYYLDDRHQRVGLVETALSPAVLPLLSRAPRVASSQIEEFSRLLDQKGISGVPRPVLPKTRELPVRQPSARLELMHIDDLVDARDGFVPDIYVGRLQACYEHSCFVPGVGEPISLRKQGDVLLRIKRNLPAELALVEQLTEFHRIARPGGGDFEQLILSPYDGPITWANFLDRRIPELRDQGWSIEVRDSFDLRLLEPEKWHLDTLCGDANWFELSAGFELEGERFNLLELLVRLLQEQDLIDDLPGDDERPLMVNLGEGRLLRLPKERIRHVLETLAELHRDRPLNRAGRLKLHKQDLSRLESWDKFWSWSPPEQLQSFARQLATPPAQARLPAQFSGQLRDYQAQGLAWLQHLDQCRFGGVLADDMGLGKTIQTLAHLARIHELEVTATCLIVAPTSVLGNWRAEAQRFTPQLRSLVWHGKDRDPGQLDAVDLVITSYATLLRDQGLFGNRTWRVLVLDEAQYIKNPRAKISGCVRRLEATQRLCLSGTPMENHLGELWSLFDFLAPGFLGDARSFRQLYRTPIEKHGDERRAAQLSRRIQPFLLRRRKDEVARELPPKSEMLRMITLSDAQAELYEVVRVSMEQRIHAALSAQGLAKSRILILDALLKLRQICCDPRLVKLEQAQAVHSSAKLDALMEMLPELIEDGRRILLFSQFTSMLELIEERLLPAKMPYLKLTGRTRNRQTLVERFQAGEAPLFLISLKAGGTGLNLTAADTVIHYDPWWNPAVENQATDRAHRIGQDKPVFVYKLLCENTVEQRIQNMQQRKQDLSDQLYQTEAAGLDETDLAWLLQPLESAAI